MMTANTHKAATSVSVRLARVATAIAIAALIGMAAVEGWQVFARYVLNDSPSWTEPVALLLMSTTMMLGAAVGVHRQGHFGFFILIESLPPRGKMLFKFLVHALVASIGIMLATLGAQLMRDAWWFDMAGVALPQGLVYLPMCVGGALIALFAGEHLFKGR